MISGDAVTLKPFHWSDGFSSVSLGKWSFCHCPGQMEHKTISNHQAILLGGWPTLLKNMKVKWEYYSQYMEDIYSQSLSVGVPLNHSIDHWFHWRKLLSQPASFHRGKRRCFVHEARGATGLLAEQVLYIESDTNFKHTGVYILQ